MRLVHIGIVTSDLEALVDLYRDLLGLEVWASEEDTARGLRFAFMGRDPALEIIQPTREGTAVDRFLRERKGGVHHLAFQVEDIEATLQALTARGYRVVDGPRRGALGHRVAFLHPRDTGYVLIELVEEHA